MATLLHIGDRTDTSKAGISSMFDDVLAQWRQHPLTIHRRSLSINNGDPGEALHPTHLKQVLYCMAVTMHEVIIDAPTALSSLIFDDRHFPLEIGDLNSAADANLTSTGIYEYLLLLITTAKLQVENAIIAMVYVDRLCRSSDHRLTRHTWRRILLGAVIISSKVWDDALVFNVDFVDVFPPLRQHDVNELERAFLDQIQYGVGVSAGLYAAYCFDIRELLSILVRDDSLATDEWLSMAKTLEIRTSESEKIYKAQGEDQWRRVRSSPLQRACGL